MSERKEEIAQRMAAAALNLEDVEREKKEAVAEYNERIKDLQGQLISLAKMYQDNTPNLFDPPVEDDIQLSDVEEVPQEAGSLPRLLSMGEVTQPEPGEPEPSDSRIFYVGEAAAPVWVKENPESSDQVNRILSYGGIQPYAKWAGKNPENSEPEIDPDLILPEPRYVQDAEYTFEDALSSVPEPGEEPEKKRKRRVKRGKF